MLPDLETPKPSSSVGGTLCLDFINANPASRGTTLDDPAPYADLTDWGLEMGLLSKGQARQLEQLAQRNPKLASDSIKRAHKLREVLKRVFSSLAAQVTPAQGDLQKVLKAHTRAIASAKLVHTEVRTDHVGRSATRPKSFFIRSRTTQFACSVMRPSSGLRLAQTAAGCL